MGWFDGIDHFVETTHSALLPHNNPLLYTSTHLGQPLSPIEFFTSYSQPSAGPGSARCNRRCSKRLELSRSPPKRQLPCFSTHISSNHGSCAPRISIIICRPNQLPKLRFSHATNHVCWFCN